MAEILSYQQLITMTILVIQAAIQVQVIQVRMIRRVVQAATIQGHRLRLTDNQ